MAIQMEKETSRQYSKTTFPKSYLLARAARKEFYETKNITIICPKCGAYPKMTMTENGERSTVRCKCGYICDTEINL